jgi:2-amino-4-hydroxy-6-hydroxymethyldihydropteridine diphosphokinase
MFQKEEIYFSIGSNLGDRLRNLQEAAERMGSRLGSLVVTSKVYESSAWGFESRYSFYNCCLCLESSLGPAELLQRMQSIERAMGRVRSTSGPAGYVDRIIDIDLIYMGDRVIRTPGLVVPHPSLEQRRFVLKPLAEIAPSLVHPVSGFTVSELLAGCRDRGTVTPVDTLTRT